MYVIRLVLVEDSKGLCTVLKNQLESEPDFHVVAEAADGAGAISVIKRFGPHIVILDIGLPDINGLDLIPLIQRSSPTSEIIIYSLYDPSFYEQEALRRGASHDVTKATLLRF